MSYGWCLLNYVTQSLDVEFAGLNTVAKLIGCTMAELKQALSTRKMRVGNDTIVQKLTQPQVICFAGKLKPEVAMVFW